MNQSIPLYIKMIAYYEQKLETIKQTLYSNSEENLNLSFQVLSKNEETITKNTLLNFFNQNLQAVNYKDIVELIWLIGDREKFTINKKQFSDYLTSSILYKQTCMIEHVSVDINSQVLKLLIQQIRVLKQIKENKLQIINNENFDIQYIFNEISNNQQLITSEQMLSYMKKKQVQFNSFDFDLLTFYLFGQKCSINFEMFKNSNLFQSEITRRSTIQEREIPQENISDSYITNLSKSFMYKQQSLMPVSTSSSIVEFKTSDFKPKSKRYQEQTYVPRPY